MPGISDIIWPLVIVGRGSSAAYYVATVDLDVFKTILAIGEDDPWAGVRGHTGNKSDPTLKINHPLHLLEHFKQTIPGYAETLVDRLDWAKKNAAVLEQAHVQIHKGSVELVSDCVFPGGLGIDKELGVRGFEIKLVTGEKVYAYKVVMAAGAGAHRVPDELKAAKKKFPNMVLDLDEFAQVPTNLLLPYKSVVVIGPNAAIDAVHKALNYKMHIHWLINLKKPEAPPMLETQPRMKAAWDDPETHKLKVYRYTKYTVGAEKAGLDVLELQVIPHEGVPMSCRGNYIVYGMGQTGDPAKTISNTIQAKLKPIFDTSHALNPTVDRKQNVMVDGKQTEVVDRKQMGERAILGYEAEGTGLKTGLEVVGALSAQVGRVLRDSKDRLDVLKKQIEEVRKHEGVWDAITTLFPVKTPFLGKDPDFLAKQPRTPLGGQLRTEIDSVAVKRPRTTPENIQLLSALEALANLLLAYHTATAYKNMGDKDPNNLGNFAKLLNLVVTTLPKGAVADNGQLTSINAALRAYATMRGRLPDYMPKQIVLPNKNMDGKLQGTTTQGQVNWNLDSIQNIAIFICASYPNLKEWQANKFIDELLTSRRDSKIGFNDKEVSEYLRRLSVADNDALKKVFNNV